MDGAAGLCGVDGETLKGWLLRHRVHSEALREEMGHWVEWLSNGSPPYAAYRALNAYRMLAADKQPGVRPLACGEIFMRFFALCVRGQTKSWPKAACGATQLCAGLECGIEASLHSVREVWPEADGWELDNGIPEGSTVPSVEEINQLEEDRARREQQLYRPADPVAIASDSTRSKFEHDTGFGTLLVDAKNAFNSLLRYVMLWHVRHLSPRASRFVFNRYRHFGLVVVRNEPGEAPHFILSEEGVAQGDPLAMDLYGLTLVPLCQSMKVAIPQSIQPAYADDLSSTGKAQHNAECLDFLVKNGPAFGYFPEPDKSFYVCKGQDELIAKHHFEKLDLTINYARGRQYLGAYIGNKEGKEQWIKNKVKSWVGSVKILARISHRHPQAAYAGFTFVLQNEWEYAARVVPGIGPHLAGIEDAIRQHFLPSLFRAPVEWFTSETRARLAHSVKRAGIGIRNPTDSAIYNYETSRHACSLLVDAIVDTPIGEATDVNLYQHSKHVGYNRSLHKERRLQREQDVNATIGEGKPFVQKQLGRASKSGHWLLSMPHRLNGNVLSEEEFVDNIRLRENLKPLDIPKLCDGCGAPMTVDHALSCKVGGLIHQRHGDAAREFSSLCVSATSRGNVSLEPYICGRANHGNNAGANGPATPTNQTTQQPNQQQQQGEDATPTLDETRGDVGCRNFWTRQRMAIFDVRITDTSARSYRNTEPQTVIERQEKEKKDKYRDACLQRRMDFTPLVYSVEGIPGRDARGAEKNLARLLSHKWRRPYSQMVQYVRVRMSIAVVRSNSLLIRGSRNKRNVPQPFIESGAAHHGWQMWNER